MNDEMCPISQFLPQTIEIYKKKLPRTIHFFLAIAYMPYESREGLQKQPNGPKRIPLGPFGPTP